MRRKQIVLILAALTLACLSGCHNSGTCEALCCPWQRSGRDTRQSDVRNADDVPPLADLRRLVFLGGGKYYPRESTKEPPSLPLRLKSGFLASPTGTDSIVPLPDK